MLGMFNLFPFLKGWEYKFHTVGRNNIVRGAPVVERRINESGWLVNIMLTSTDAYGKLYIAWQGQELETSDFEFYPQLGLDLGATVQDPIGWVQRYFRPDPESTAGLYVCTFFSGGTQGSAWPYVPTVTMSVSLPETSTQKTALVTATAMTIAITNRDAFLKSLRSILGVKGRIDPAILRIGPAELREDVTV